MKSEYEPQKKGYSERNQSVQKKRNILIVVGEFLRSPDLSIQELATRVNLSPSSVQRYLNDEYIKHYLGNDIDEQIQTYLSEHKKLRSKRGGLSYASNHRALKDEQGKFIGSIKEESELNRNLKKENDIIRFTVFYLSHPTLSLEELAQYFGATITRDYVYDCLTDHRMAELLGEEMATQVQKQLANNRYQLPKKGM